MAESTIFRYHQYAALATASYVRMGGRPLTGSEFSQQAASLQQAGGRLPTSLANRLFVPSPTNQDAWTILSYYGSDMPAIQDPIASADRSGLGATLFERVATNGTREKVLALRGTELGQNGAVDLFGAGIGQIGIVGLALTQVVSMVNLIQRMRAAPGTPVVQVKVNASLIPSEGALTVSGVPPMFLTFSRYVGKGEGGILDGEMIKVTGHSLGGHLAYMAARLFPGVVDPQVYVYNAAGYDPSTADFITAGGPPALAAATAAKVYLLREFGAAAIGTSTTRANQLTEPALKGIASALRGTDPGLGTPAVVNIRSEDLAPGDDTSFVASVMTGADRYGAAIDLPTEHNNHTIEPLMDALALQALVEPWQGAAFDRTDLIRVLDASSNERTRSYEEFAEGLLRLAIKDGKFLDDDGQQWTRDKLPTSDESSIFPFPFIDKGEISARNAFHDAVLRTQDALKNISGLQIRSSVDVPVGSLANLALSSGDDGIAYRYALRALNPFAVVGPTSLYEPHNVNGPLDRYKPAEGIGAISDVWIVDRATFLKWKVLRNVADNTGDVVSPGSSDTSIFVDRPNDPVNADTIQVVSAARARAGASELALSRAPKYIFGGGEADYFSGGTNADHLFGESGDDVLTGEVGNDYLEGGQGHDYYVYQSGHGDDTVLDVDSAGAIVFDGVQLRSGERVAFYQWRFTSDFGREFFYWVRNEKDGSRSLTITARDTPGSIQIRGYQDGALGIALPDFAPEVRPAVEMEAGTEGNDILRHPFQAVKLGLGGEDIVYGHADFWLEGGGDNDWLPYEYSADEPARGFTAFGGQGDDFAHGSTYDDKLHAEGVAELEALVEGTNSPEAGPEREVLFGAAGDDVVAGGRGDDWIAGGIGSDVLYGGAGNDVLSGAGEIFMGDDLGQPGLDPQAQTFFNVHTSGRFDQTHPGILINVPNRISDYGLSPALIGTVARDGLDESGWRDGADSMFAGAGDDEAWGGFGDDSLAGEAGNDALMGESGNDLLDGGAGDDRLVGGEGSDVLIGGAGADLLEGGAGADIYEVDASDTVRDTQGRNRIRFGADVRRESLRAIQAGSTLVLTGVAGGTVTIENGLAGAMGEVDVEYGSFGFGEFLSSIAAADLIVQGSDADEEVFGASGNDRITAGRGSDLVGGGGGEDVYVFNLGDGFDVLTDPEDTSVIEFGPGINAADVTANVFFNFSNGGYDMYVGYGPGDTVAITNGPLGTIAEYRFADGAALSHADVIARDTQGFSLAGTDGNDSLFGGGGNDSLSGSVGDDVLRGRAGRDSLSGDDGNDELDGGEGNDTLFGSADNDTLSGGSGDDVLVGDEGNDSLDGGAGTDRLEGESGDDVLAGSAGADRLQGGEGDDTYIVNAGDGADIINDIAGGNTIRFGAGIAPDSLAASILNATDGGIYLSLQYGASDHLLVKQDPARPGISAATFSFANGEDLTQGELMARTLSVPLDYVAGQNAILLYGSRFDDRVLASPQDDFVDGGAGNDLLQGEDGNDVLIGGDGDDLLLGGAGDDALTGGAGRDTYALRRGMGRDVVTEDPANPGTNTLQLGADMVFADLAAHRQGESLYLHVRNARDGVVITDYFAGANGDAWQVGSAAGTITPLADVLANLEQAGRAASVADAYQQFEERARTAYSSGLYGAGYTLGGDGRFRKETTFNGTFFSSHGVRDVGFSVVTQAGDSPFFLRESAPLLLTGQTFSSEQASRTVQVLNTANSRVVPVRDGGNAHRTGARPPAMLDVDALLASGASGILLPDSVVPIYDGQVVTRQFSLNPAPEPQVAALATYSGGAVPVYSTQTITHFHQESSDSWEMQIAEITGGDSDNMIDGGPGFSLVDGGGGNDLLWANGSIDLPSGPLGSDSIPGALLYGNTGDDELRGSDFDDVMIGGTGDDAMRGGEGNDTYLLFAGDGGDYIFDEGATKVGIARENAIELPEGVTLGDLSASFEERVEAFSYRMPADGGQEFVISTPTAMHATLLVSWNGSSVRIVLPHTEQNAGTGIDLLRFSDGSSATLAEIFALAGGTPDVDPHNRDDTDPAIGYGGGGNDTLHGGGIGGAGRDTFIGSAFDDEFFGGEVVAEIDFDFTGGASSLSTLWDEGNVYRGGAGDDILWATAGSDVFEYDLGDGTDTVTDMLHDETFLYGYGGPIGSAQHHLPHWQDPTAVQPAHQALLFSSSDTLKLGLGIAPRDVRAYRSGESGAAPDLLFTMGSGGVRFENWYRAQVNQLGRIEFADGTVWDAATIAAVAAGAPALVRGTEFDDFLSGGSGDEAFEGGEGNDTYFIGIGGSVDTIVDSGGDDTLVLGVNPDDISLGLGSLTIRIGDGGDAVHLENFDANDVLSESDVETFRFADGTELTYADLVARGFDLFGTAGDDAINGTNVVDRMDGGAGDDALAGGLGGDTYRFGPGSGRDLIREAASVTDSDTLEVLANPGEVTVTREADNIMVALGGTADRVAIEWFGDPNARVENVTFADGTAWDAATFEAQIQGETNQAPAVASPVADQGALEDVPFTYTVPNDAFSDPDGDALSYVAEAPAWLSFDPATRTFSGTPRNANVGSYPVHVIATDAGGLSASDEFAVSVANVNDAPVVAQALPERVFDAGSPFVFSVPAQTFADEDAGDSLALSASLFGGAPLPAWLAFDPASATFTGNPKARHIGISRIAVRATDAAGASAVSDFGLSVRASAGATVNGSRGDDFLYGNSGDETLKAKGGNDYLYGDAGDDVLRGGAGNDILQGGAGNDVLHAGRGNDVIAFNRGDGIDTVYGGRDGGNTLSFGGGIGYDDLALSRHGKDLVVNVGAAEKVVLKNWYAGMKSVLHLQLVSDAGVETFDFLGLARSFDAARKATPGVSSWALTNALLQWHLSRSDDEALGGDLAYWCGKNRGLKGIGVQIEQQVFGVPGFGLDAQSLRPFEGLREGFAKLA